MKIARLAIAALACLAGVGAQATVVTSTSGLETTYTEDFNGGSSFAGGWFNAPLTSDDYLLLLNGATSSFSFSSAAALSSLVVDFWYASNTSTGSASIGQSVNLLGRTGSAFEVGLLNPGAGGSNRDSHASLSFSNLAAGTYTLKFKAPSGLLNGLKVDDVRIITTAVPEPGSTAMLLAGLGALGLMARRRTLRG